MSAEAPAARKNAPSQSMLCEMRRVLRLQNARGDEQRHRGNGDVDVEDPAPGHVVGEESADDRSGDTRQREDASHPPLVLPTLPRWDDVTDDRLGADHEAAGADALDGAEADELDHVLRKTGEHRPGDEDHDRSLEQELAPVEVAQLPVERGRHRRGEQVGRDHPGKLVQSPEIAHDGRQRGRNDGLIERGEEHAQHQGAEHRVDLALRHAVALRRCSAASSSTVAAMRSVKAT